MALMIIVFEILVLAFIMPLALEGKKDGLLDSFLCVDLSYQKLITEPPREYRTIFRSELSNAHLAGANLKQANLQNAMLNDANLCGAFLVWLRLLIMPYFAMRISQK
jgi:hypothetical protein